MIRRKLFAVAFAASNAFTAATFAQAPCDNQSCGQRFHTDYQRNNQWPHPFRETDANVVLEFFSAQRAAGWKAQNTLGGGMFDPATNCLTDAGRAHLRWIVTQAPADRRTVFVLQGSDTQATATRVEATQVAVSQIIPVGPLPAIYLTDRDAPGSSGAYQTAVNRALSSSVPAPRLTGAGGGTSGTSTGTP